MSHTQIRGNIECTNSENNIFICESSFVKSNIFFNNFYTELLNLGLTEINDMLRIKKLTIKSSCILSSSRINQLWFEDVFWEKEFSGSIYLDGLEYNRLSGKNLDSKILINLLEKMPEFKTQPYRQLVKVLRNSEDNIYADDIMIKYNDIQASKNNFILRFLKKIYKITTGYGYRPKNMLYTLIIVWFLCSLFYWNASKVAVFAPNNPLVFQKKDYYKCYVEENGTALVDMFNWKKYNSTNNWIDSKLEGEYTTFNPFMYSLDVIFPIVDLQVEKDWGQYVPSNDWTLNDFTRWLMWFEILFGWGLGYILLSYYSGILSKRD